MTQRFHACLFLSEKNSASLEKNPRCRHKRHVASIRIDLAPTCSLLRRSLASAVTLAPSSFFRAATACGLSHLYAPHHQHQTKQTKGVSFFNSEGGFFFPPTSCSLLSSIVSHMPHWASQTESSAFSAMPRYLFVVTRHISSSPSFLASILISVSQ